MTILGNNAADASGDSDSALLPIYGESIESLSAKSREDLLRYALEYRKKQVDARLKAKGAYERHRPIIAARKQLKAATISQRKAEKKARAAEEKIQSLKEKEEDAKFESLISDLIEA